MICLTFAIPVNENHCLIGMENIPSPAGLPAPFRPRLYRTDRGWLFGFQGSAIQIAGKTRFSAKTKKFSWKSCSCAQRPY